jgi:predicted dienelactone hydrolase
VTILRRHRAHAARLAAVVVVLAGLVVTTGVGALGTTASAAKRPPVPASCLPAGEPASATTGPYPVGERTVTFVDTSRPTAADPARGLPAHPDRTLVTTLLYPAAGPTTKVSARAPQPVVGAAPAAGSFPLVEFSHGVTASGPDYVPVLRAWARAGYVVAAPTFPLTSGPGATINDVVNQPADVSFILTSMAGLAADPTDPLFGHVAPDCTAIAGHSLGAITTLATVYDSCCREPRARAAISISGWALPIDGGNYADAPPVPLLLLHGDQDTTIPITFSQQAYDELNGFRWFVTFHGAGHVGLLEPPYDTELQDAVLSFLDYELKGDNHRELGFAQRIGRSAGLETLQHAT